MIKGILIVLGLLFLFLTVLPAAVSVLIPVFTGVGLIVIVGICFKFLFTIFSKKDIE